MNITREYVAGFFDGEGCVNFTRHRNSYIPRILIVNTNEEVLRAIQARYGGDVQQAYRTKKEWKPAFTLRISNRSAYEFLKDIYDFLIVKRAQAETIFGWAALAPGSSGKWDRDALDLIVRRMTFLNKKGRHSERDPVDVLLEDRGINVDDL